MFGKGSTAPALPRISDPTKSIEPVVDILRIIKVLTYLSVIFFSMAVISLLVGPGGLEPLSVLRDLFAVLRGDAAAVDETHRIIVFHLRLPRIGIAAVVGASLAVSGVIFQAVLRNPLADPYILGISGGAALGAIVGILLGGAAVIMGLSALSFLGAVVTVLILFGISGASRERSSHTLLLTGVIINAFFSAVVMFLLAISRSDRLHSILFWLMGDLSNAERRDIIITGTVLLLGMIVMMGYARVLNLLVMGDDTAAQLGVEVTRVRKGLIIAASMVTAAAVSVSGTVGFVGLIIPHIMRMIIGSDHRLLLPAAALFGAAFLVAADTASRVVLSPVELPIGVITALCGAPFFYYLLRVRRF